MEFAESFIERIKDMYDARRVYGDPVETDGVTIIPAAAVRGGAGGGGGSGFQGPHDGDDDDAAEGEGSGAGFGIDARPVGAWVITADEVTWKPAVDVQRLVLGGFIALAVVSLASALFGGCRRG